MKCNNQHNGDGELCLNCSSASPRLQNVNIGMEVVKNEGELTGVSQTTGGIERQNININVGGRPWIGSKAYLRCNRYDPTRAFRKDLQSHLLGASPVRVHAYTLPFAHHDCPEVFLERLKEIELGTMKEGVVANPIEVNWSKEEAICPEALDRIQERILEYLNRSSSLSHYNNPSEHFAPKLQVLAERYDYVLISHRLSSETMQSQAERLIKDYLRSFSELKFTRSRLLLFFFVENGAFIEHSAKKLINRFFKLKTFAKPKTCADRFLELLKDTSIDNRVTHCTLPTLEMIGLLHANEMLNNASDDAIHPQIKIRIRALYADPNNTVRMQRIVDECNVSSMS